MRKLFVLFALTIFMLGGLSSLAAQERKNAVYVDLGYLITGLTTNGGIGFGLGYERALGSYLSFKGNLGFLGIFKNNDESFLGFDVVANIRAYPMGSALGKFYLEGHFDYTPITITMNNAAAQSHIFFAGAEIGWKGIFKNGLFLEPYIGYAFHVSGDLNVPGPGTGTESYSVDSLTGLKLGISLGWAF
jgi:hypothetical protein